MNEKIDKLKTSKEADTLAANAERLGAPELAAAARARGVELRAAERPARAVRVAKHPGSRKPIDKKIDGECIYMNGVFESVLQEIEHAQSENPDTVCYLQPYTQAPIKRLKNEPPSVAAPWGLFISTTTQLTAVSYEADIVEWQDKTQISIAELVVLNKRLAAMQPGEGAVHLEGKEGTVGINLIGITRLKRLDPAIPVSEFKKISDGLPLKERTQAGGYSYVMPPHVKADAESS